MQQITQPTRSSRLRRLAPLAGGAAVMAGLALANRARAKEAVRDNPPIGTFIKVDGVTLHYVEKGSGPPILLVHGNGVMIQDWIISGLFDELAKTNRVIAVDRPGFGHSARPRGTRWTPERQAQLFAELLEQLDAAPALAVGHSYGALVVAAMALDHPERLKGAVLLGGYFYPSARADVAMISGSAIPGYGDVLNHTLMPLAAEALQKPINRKIFGPAPTPPAWQRDFPWAMAMRPTRMRAGASDAVHMISSASALSQRYAEIKVPVAIVAGKGDRMVDTAAQSERLHQAMPNSRLVLIDEVGHMVHHSAMRDVAAAIRTA